ncbi:hypothetical protein BH23ACT9_BH23ACT9_21350 [soil metagenome]
MGVNMNLNVWRKSTVLIGVMALLVGLLVPGAQAQGPDCGPIVRNADIVRGMTGQGLTVVQGTAPHSFDVEVLGVLTNGVGVGRDMIIVEVSAPFLDDVGGIWQGMSGSPVYVDGRLLGAVAYGLSFASSAIGGLTPAEDMVDLVALRDANPSFAAAEPAAEATATGELAREIQRRIGGDGASFAQSGVTLRRLSVPLSVSGLSATRLDVLQDAATSAGLAVTAHSGSSAAFQQVPTTTQVPTPGQNLAVAASFGDVTFAAVGTATLVCDGRLIGFGHPFRASGDTIAGAATADAITIVPDDTFAPFKLANIQSLFGTIDQDRFAGVRSTNGVFPTAVPVRSTVTDEDTGRTRDGRTDVVAPDAIADLSAFHLLGNIDTVIDRIGEGGSAIGYTVRGRGSDSGAFTLRRDNVFVSPFDIAFESIFELLSHVATLSQFPAEDVTIDRIDIIADVEQDLEAYRIEDVRIAVDGEPAQAVEGLELFVRPGSVIDIEVDLTDPADGATTSVSLQAIVPEDAFGFGFLEITGGGGGFFDECFFDPAACVGAEAATVQDLVDTLAAEPRNDEVTASLALPTGSGGDPFPGPTPTEEPVPFSDDDPAGPSSTAGSAGATSRSGAAGSARYAQQEGPVIDRQRVDRFVSGGRGFGVFVDGASCPGCPPAFIRFAGDERIGTAAAIAGGVFGFSDTVVIAPAGDYPAALIAGPLAAAEFAPVLLSDDQTLSAVTATAIRQLGATRAILVAPDGQLTGSIEDDLQAAGVTTVDRIGGADRYEVAGAVAAQMGGTRAWLVEGENDDPARGWPDAMSAATIAGYEGVPILLTRAGDLPAATAATLTDQDISDISIAGGTTAVSQAVADEVVTLGITIERIAGASRDETAYLLAQRAIELGAFPGTTWLVTANNFPDALAAAPAVVATGGVMIMGDGTDIYRTPGAVRHLTDIQSTGPVIAFVGGFSALSPQVEDQVFDILVGGGEPPVGEESPFGPAG